MRRAVTLAWVLLAGGSCSGEATPQPAAPSPPAAVPSNHVVVPADSPMLRQIRVEAVGEHELPTDEVVSPAKLEIDPAHYSKVLLPVAGRIVEVHVRVGDHVAAGDPVVTVDSPDADAAIADLQQAEADVAAASASLTKAERDLERVQGLFEHDAVAKKEVVNAEAAVAEARAESKRARAEKQQASRRLKILGLHAGKKAETIRVQAPIGGKVLELDVAPGEYRTDTADPLMTIANLDSLFVSADVAENAIRLISVGEPVEIELVAFPDERFEAKVKRIADTVDPETRTIEVQAELPNPEGRFRPEMFGRVRHGHVTAKVAALPATSIVQRDQENVVLVEVAVGEYEIRPVTTGARAGDIIAITGGVRLGERVVVDGGLLLLPQ